MDTLNTFSAGCQLIQDVLQPEGFIFIAGDYGRSSGGDFASSQFVKADRILEVHFRYSLGLVTYHIGSLSLSHEAYMQALLGRGGSNQYPGFSNDPLDGFRHLQFDLVHFCGDFVSGSAEVFKQCVAKAQTQSQVTGLKALSSSGAV